MDSLNSIFLCFFSSFRQKHGHRDQHKDHPRDALRPVRPQPLQVLGRQRQDPASLPRLVQGHRPPAGREWTRQEHQCEFFLVKYIIGILIDVPLEEQPRMIRNNSSSRNNSRNNSSSSSLSVSSSIIARVVPVVVVVAVVVFSETIQFSPQVQLGLGRLLPLYWLLQNSSTSTRCLQLGSIRHKFPNTGHQLADIESKFQTPEQGNNVVAVGGWMDGWLTDGLTDWLNVGVRLSPTVSISVFPFPYTF